MSVQNSWNGVSSLQILLVMLLRWCSALRRNSFGSSSLGSCCCQHQQFQRIDGNRSHHLELPFTNKVSIAVLPTFNDCNVATFLQSHPPTEILRFCFIVQLGPVQVLNSGKLWNGDPKSLKAICNISFVHLFFVSEKLCLIEDHPSISLKTSSKPNFRFFFLLYLRTELTLKITKSPLKFLRCLFSYCNITDD